MIPGLQVRSAQPTYRGDRDAAGDDLAMSRKSRRRSAGCWFFRWLWNQPAKAAVGKHQERRLQDSGQNRQDEGAADDYNGEGLLGLVPDSVRECGGKQPEGGAQRGHQHRPEALLGGVSRAILEGLSLSPLSLRIGDDENRVLNGNSKNRDEAHRRGDREVLAGDQQRQHS